MRLIEPPSPVDDVTREKTFQNLRTFGSESVFGHPCIFLSNLILILKESFLARSEDAQIDIYEQRRIRMRRSFMRLCHQDEIAHGRLKIHGGARIFEASLGEQRALLFIVG